jgi:hypothetical protein
MEGMMASVVALDASPASVLQSMRGSIVAARVAHPEVLHVEIRDPRGGLWRLSTQDARWSPEDPARFVGLELESVSVADDGGLHCRLSDGSALVVRPTESDAVDDPPNWELITPDGLALEFGPGLRWQVSRADVPISSRN